jgi:hypothetical protein
MSIFISYRRRDAAFAARLRDRLELAFPKEVFLEVYGSASSFNGAARALLLS